MEAIKERKLELDESLLRRLIRSELEADGKDYKTIAKRIRRAMTEPVNDVDDLIDDGYIEMYDKDKKRMTRDDLKEDGDSPDSWIISIEAVMLLHIYQSRWFGQWQRLHSRRN